MKDSLSKGIVIVKMMSITKYNMGKTRQNRLWF